MTLKAQLSKAIERLITDLQDELKAQGHVATGRLVDSLEYKIALETETSLVFDIYMEDYYQYVNDGVSANRIPFTRQRGGQRRGGTSQYIQALINWAKVVRPGIDENEAKSFAFAIANKHAEEGMPTRGSYAYSNNGRRKNFLDVVQTSFENRILDEIDLDSVADIFIQRLTKTA